MYHQDTDDSAATTINSMMFRPRIRLRSILLLTMFACWTGVVAAQEKAQEKVIEEVVVTASKKGATNLLNTAVTATVVDGDQLEFRGIRNVEDLQFQTPGLVVDHGVATPKVSIRGIGHDNFILPAENGVAVYANDIIMGRTQSMLAAFFDLDRTEVLKGPQGTAFGRNATGGSVNFVSRQPVEGTEAEFGLTGGSFSRREIYGIFNYGSERYGFRVGGKYNEDDGYVDNLLTGSELNGVEQTLVKASVFFAPTHNFEGVLRIDYTDEELARPGTPIVAVEPISLPIDVLGGTGGFDPDEDYEIFNDLDPIADVETTLASLHLDWDMGDLHLRSISGYLAVDAPSIQDADQSDLDVLVFDNRIQSDQYSQEFVLSGSAGALDWLGGVYYLREEADMSLLVAFARDALPGGGTQTYDDSQELTSKAVFAQGTWTLTDRTRVIAGVRYTEDEKEYSINQNFILGALNTVPGLVVPLCQDSFNKSWEEATWELTLERDLSDDTFGYVKANTGFKAGGFNAGLCGVTFDPEEITAFEIGYKGTFSDGRLTAAVSAFYYDYTDIQITQIESLTAIQRNAAEAEVYGVDLELRALLTERISADVALSWLPTSEYESYSSIDPLDLRVLDGDPTTVPEVLDLTGNRLNRAPDYSGTIGVNYNGILSADWQVDARLEVYFTGDIAYSPFDRPNAFNASLGLPGLVNDANIQKGYELVNAYVSFHHGDTWTIRAYGKNLTDKYYFTGIVESSAVGHIYAEYGRPREAGVQVIYRFNGN